VLKIIHLLFKSSFSQLLLLTISAVLALGIFSSALQAQPGSPNYNYPILQQKDFTLYIDMSKYIDNPSAMPSSLYSDYNVSEEYATAVFLKISLNVVAIVAETKDEVEKQYGKSFLFNANELALYHQNEEPVNQAVGKFLQTLQDSN
jgi:hypothetical protein